MPAKLNEYDRIVALFEEISPDYPERKYDIENLQTLIDLSSTITLQDRQQLSRKLFYLRLEPQAARTTTQAKNQSG